MLMLPHTNTASVFIALKSKQIDDKQMINTDLKVQVGGLWWEGKEFSKNALTSWKQTAVRTMSVEEIWILSKETCLTARVHHQAVHTYRIKNAGTVKAAINCEWDLALHWAHQTQAARWGKVEKGSTSCKYPVTVRTTGRRQTTDDRRRQSPWFQQKLNHRVVYYSTLPLKGTWNDCSFTQNHQGLGFWILHVKSLTCWWWDKKQKKQEERVETRCQPC